MSQGSLEIGTRSNRNENYSRPIESTKYIRVSNHFSLKEAEQHWNSEQPIWASRESGTGRMYMSCKAVAAVGNWVLGERLLIPSTAEGSPQMRNEAIGGNVDVRESVLGAFNKGDMAKNNIHPGVLSLGADQRTAEQLGVWHGESLEGRRREVPKSVLVNEKLAGPFHSERRFLPFRAEGHITCCILNSPQPPMFWTWFLFLPLPATSHFLWRSGETCSRWISQDFPERSHQLISRHTSGGLAGRAHLD